MCVSWSSGGCAANGGDGGAHTGDSGSDCDLGRGSTRSCGKEDCCNDDDDNENDDVIGTAVASVQLPLDLSPHRANNVPHNSNYRIAN